MKRNVAQAPVAFLRQTCLLCRRFGWSSLLFEDVRGTIFVFVVLLGGILATTTLLRTIAAGIMNSPCCFLAVAAGTLHCSNKYRPVSLRLRCRWESEMLQHELLGLDGRLPAASL